MRWLAGRMAGRTKGPLVRQSVIVAAACWTAGAWRERQFVEDLAALRVFMVLRTHPRLCRCLGREARASRRGKQLWRADQSRGNAQSSDLDGGLSLRLASRGAGVV